MSISMLAGAERPDHPLSKYASTMHIFCAGCGYGAIAQAVTRVYAERKLDKMKYVFFTGIGCHSALPTLLPSYTVMTLHGRLPAVVTGAKLANPELKPICFCGDGDLLAIGTNHFVHACRRNLDMVLILLHNNVYGMTGGQSAPTTPTEYKATTAPYGYLEKPFDGCELAIASGATFVSRWTSAHIKQFMNTLNKAIDHRGLSFIEVVTTCPTYFGRKNKMPEPIDLFRWIRDSAVSIKKAEGMSEEELEGKFLVGEFQKTERPDLNTIYKGIIERAQGD